MRHEGCSFAVTKRGIDLDRLRVELRRMNRGELMIIADRAIDLVPQAKLRKLIGDMVAVNDFAIGSSSAPPLLDEVRRFHDAALNREFYKSFNVNSKNYMEKSRGTETFIAEFDRLMVKCIRAAANKRRAPIRDTFELLFGLLRRIDEDSDSIIFFADEAGSWQVGVDWRQALPAYFQCLADTASGDDFAREVHRAISDFSEYDRPKHMTAARTVANAEQKAALRRMPVGEGP